MTNSTELKTPKAKGPIRTGAVVPSLVLIALVYGYFYLFFDSHLRSGMEFVASRVHGAEVNIGRVTTSFWGASFRMQNLQVTNKEQPTHNLFEIGDMKFQMLWDALLRAKFVVEESSVLDIQAYTKRKKPGFVLPPPPPGESVLAKVQDQVVQQTKQRLNGNFLGDIANVLTGTDPKDQLKNIQAELKSTLKAEALEKELTAKKAEWEKRIKDLPKPQEIKALEAKIKALNLNTKNPIEFAQKLKQAKEILAEAQAKVKQVDQTQKDFTSDITSYTQAVASLQQLAAQDVADLQKRLQIPSIDPKEFSTQLFLGQIESRLVSLRKYVELARKYMPPKKTAEEKAAAKAEQIVPRARGAGVNVSFPITTGYPLFWLKKAAISSELTQSEWAGKVSGALTDATTDPVLIGRPMKLQLQGDFPKQEIRGFDFIATMDHTTEKAKESLRVKVASVSVPAQMFSDSPAVRFGIKESRGGGGIEATLVDQTLDIGLQSRLDKPAFSLEAQNKQVQEILSAVLAGISIVTMEAKVSGSWDKFHIDVDSNIGRELSAGFQRQLQAKVGEAKAKLDAFVQEKLNPAKKKVQDQLAGLTGGPGKLLGDNKSQMDGALKDAEGSAQGGGGAKSSPIEKGKGLLKGFGF